MPFWTVAPARDAELMDDPALPESEHLQALGGLARINAVSRTAARLAAAVERLLVPGGTAMVVDLACGGGDVTVDLAARLGRSPHSHRLSVVGVDVSPRAVARARRLAVDRGSRATFSVADVAAAGCPPCDVAVSSLFLHHLDDEAAVGLLASMAAAARLGIVVSDLVRSRLGLALAVAGTTVLSRSRVVHVDGPLSVRAARTPAEYRELAAAAGLGSATVRRIWPERVLLEWARRSTSGRSAGS